MAWLKSDDAAERKLPEDSFDVAQAAARARPLATGLAPATGLTQQRVAAAPAPAAAPAAAVDATQAKQASSILGPTLRFKGELRAEEDFTLQGQIEGSIHHTQNLTIGPDGLVKGDSRALNVVVDGTVEGDMYALESISIRATARVNGNLFAPRISIAEGANFNGRIDMATAAKAAKSIVERQVERQHAATLTPGEVDKSLATGQ
jgi:cytoskeletal protein CcmA (bactofilin family)